jgi:hypothetical protein
MGLTARNGDSSDVTVALWVDEVAALTAPECDLVRLLITGNVGLARKTLITTHPCCIHV